MDKSQIQDEVVKHHIRHLINSVDALDANRSLARSLELAKADLPNQPLMRKFSAFFTSNSNNVNQVDNKVDEIEKARAKSEKKLKKIVFTMCKQSTKTLKAPNQKNHRKMEQKVAQLSLEADRFHNKIDQLTEQFKEWEAEMREQDCQNKATFSDAADSWMLVPQAIYTPDLLKVLPLSKSKKRSISQRTLSNISATTAAIAAEESILLPSPPESYRSPTQSILKSIITIPASTPLPDYIKSLLEATQGLLTPLRTYTLDGYFGFGGQGIVHRAKLGSNWNKNAGIGGRSSNSATFALKIQTITEESVHDVISEVAFAGGSLLKGHPNILTAERCSIFCRHSDNSQFYIALAFEPMADGSLANLARFRRWPEQFIACIIKQVLEGLKFIHSKLIIHNDIKPANLLLHNGTVKIADFGKSIDLNELGLAKSSTARYTSPEVARARLSDDKSRMECTTAVDIWALGASLYELLAGVHPFFGLSHRNVLTTVNTQGLHLPKYENYSSEAKNIFVLMTKTNPVERPSAECLLADPFIAMASTSNELANFVKQQTLQSQK